MLLYASQGPAETVQYSDDVGLIVNDTLRPAFPEMIDVNIAYFNPGARC